MVICIGAGSFAEALEWTAQIYAAAGARLAKRGRAARRGRRRRLLAGVQDQRGRPRRAGRRDRRCRPRARRRRRHRARHRRDAALPRRRATTSRSRTARSSPSRCTPCCCAGSSAIRSSRSRIRSPRTTPRRMRAFTKAPARSRSSATISSSPRPSACKAANGACNTVLLKPNQVGTVTETLACWDAARAARLPRDRLGALRRDRGRLHRAPRGRLGRRPAQGRQLLALERMAKWNEALRIEEALGAKALPFPAGKLFK